MRVLISLFALTLFSCADEAEPPAVNTVDFVTAESAEVAEQTVVIKPLHEAEFHVIAENGSSSTAWVTYERTETRRESQQEGIQWDEEEFEESKGTQTSSIDASTECTLAPVLLRNEGDIDVWQVTLTYRREREIMTSTWTETIEVNYDGSGPMQIAGDDRHQIWIRPRDWEE